MVSEEFNATFLPDYGYGGRDLNYTTESICDIMNDEVTHTQERGIESRELHRHDCVEGSRVT